MNIILETDRLILRNYTPDDFDALYRVISDPETMAHYPKPYDEKGTHRWLDWTLRNYREYGFGWWAVILRETGEFIGDCGITMQMIDGQPLPEIGYHIHKTYWRKGYGKEAARAVRDWGFEHTDYNALYSYMTTGNTASWKTAEAIGMKRIASFEDDYFKSMYTYEITRNDWKILNKF